MFDLLDSKQLILGFNIWKGSLKLFLPLGIRIKSMPCSCLTFGVKFEQVGCHFHHRVPHAAFGEEPVCSPEPAGGRRGTIRPDIARDAVCLVNRHIEAVVVLIFNGQVFALNTAKRRAVETDKLPNAMVNVYHPVSRFEFAVDCFWRF